MTKHLNMRRKIPLFSLKAHPGMDYSQLLMIPEIKKVILEEAVVAIKDGINKNKKKISLFEIANSDCYIELEKDKWKPTLETALKYYVEKEEYDVCVVCRDLINKL
jgi:hypothetical protein